MINPSLIARLLTLYPNRAKRFLVESRPHCKERSDEAIKLIAGPGLLRGVYHRAGNFGRPVGPQ
jgi:hypothetical protein